MADHHTLRDKVRESRVTTVRIITAGVITALLLLLLGGRLFYLQILDHERLATESQANRLNLQPLPATRGLIYDRDGRLLAENVPTYSLEVVPERTENLEATLAALREVIPFSDAERKRFLEEVKRSRSFESIPLRLRLSQEEVARFAIDRHRFPGVDIEARLSRHYPLGDITSHVVGYVGRITAADIRGAEPDTYRGQTHIGKVGIESAYEEVLRGTTGFEQVETNAQGRVLSVVEREDPVPGRDLHLTIDAELHRAAHEAFGKENGALVALEPETGDILAMVSSPTYDPNGFVQGMENEALNLLDVSEHRPLFNRALSGRYPPGSTIKPLVGLAGLETDTVHADDEVDCKGHYEPEFKDERTYRDWKRDGHGPTDLYKSIAESCDVYYYDLSYHLGIDELAPFLERFGLGRPTGIDLEGERHGVVPSRDWKRENRNVRWFPGETLITGIGQGYMLATPLQLAEATATLANGGHRMQPRVVGATEGPEGREPVEPVEQADLDLDPKNIRAVTEGMEGVVHDLRGTARTVGWQIDYRMAGKTGTAQVFGLEEGEEYVEEDIVKRLRDHALFVAFAPADDPEIAVAVIVENGGSGGAVAAPVAERVITRFLESRAEEDS
ncbi:MAG: penicillin-binding protein 2 [Thiohalospira sp.]